MSYLNRLRLVFSGTFQADVSTVNNEVRHYDNATFEPRFQELQDDTTGVENGWWNPEGSGAFRLIDCRVTAVYYEDGTMTDNPQTDPVVGKLIGGSDDRVAGKLVDIDPQWQLASEPWGLKVLLTDDAKSVLFGGDYKPNAFRDLFFGRLAGAANDAAASASFQSVLENVQWTDRGVDSRFLKELKGLTQGNRLSIRLTTFGYSGNAKSGRYTLGTVSGVIGPAFDDEPTSFIPGRRFAPQSPGASASAFGIGYFTGRLDEQAAKPTLLLDLSNAMPLAKRTGDLTNLGDIQVGLLKDQSVQETAALTAENFETLGFIPYWEPGWLLATGGIAAIELTQDQARRAGQTPLALAVYRIDSLDPPRLAIAETTDGVYTDVEPLSARADAGDKIETTVYVRQYGRPVAGENIILSQLPPAPFLGGGSPSSPLQPRAAIPDIGTPANGILNVPEAVQTDKSGRALISFKAGKISTPRGYLDGQLYQLDFKPAKLAAPNRAPFDFFTVHVRDDYPVPATPTWEKDILPIFQQYGNLYPVMSRRLVDLSDPRDVYRHRQILLLAFGLPITDPNYMPVTRDLSEPKKQTILTWLKGLESGQDPSFSAALAELEKSGAPRRAAPAAAEAPDQEPEGGKTSFARTLARTR